MSQKPSKPCCRVGADRLCVHGRPCQLQMEEQQVGGQQKNGQQYRLFGPIVWLVHKHYKHSRFPGDHSAEY